jgi:cysteine-rich repeat protein
MATKLGALVVVVVLGGCVKMQSLDCGDFTCPQSTTCAPELHLCVSDEQAHVCDALGEGMQCTADKLPGVCTAGYCLPGCGDGVEGTNEECDDGNFASHDGCSSRCMLESLAWTEVHDRWTPIAGAAVAHLARNGGMLVRFGGHDAGASSNAHWERIQGTWRQVTAGLPPPRHFTAYGYDAARDMLVIFGGTDNTVNFDETWEYDGTTWTKVDTIGKPSARYGAAMAFDDARDVFVLFGGLEQNSGTFGFPQDTWEYNPAAKTWTKITLTVQQQPTARLWHAMTWDAAAQRVVLFGGSGPGIDQYAWRYDGANRWVKTTGVGPTARVAPSLAYDASTQRVVLYGGRLGAVTDVTSDTWVFDTANGAWTQRSVVLSPPGRYENAVVYDPVAQRVLSIGGFTGSSFFDDVWSLGPTGWADVTPRYRPANPQSVALAYDSARGRTIALGLDRATDSTVLWEFDGQNWSVPANATRPRRTHYAIAYDAVRQRTVVFGGLAPGSVTLQTAWEWDGSSWYEPSVSAAPPARYFGSMVQAGPDGGVLLLGGYPSVSSGTAVPGSWIFDGVAWRELTTPTELPAEGVPMLAYDEAQQRVLLLTRDSATWEFKNGSWSRLQLAASPPPRAEGALVFRPERGRVLLYGGRGYNDAWELDGDTWRELALIGEHPSPRVFASATYHERVRSIVLYGGGTLGGGLLEDTWLLQYGSLTPDEVCGNGDDDDGDAHGDDIDPDCVF